MTYETYREIKFLKVKGPETKDQQLEYEALDMIDTKGMEISSQKCRKLKMGGKQWSLSLQKARDTILFWTIILKRLTNCNISARRLLRLKKKLKITGDTRESKSLFA